MREEEREKEKEREREREKEDQVLQSGHGLACDVGKREVESGEEERESERPALFHLWNIKKKRVRSSQSKIASQRLSHIRRVTDFTFLPMVAIASSEASDTATSSSKT